MIFVCNSELPIPDVMLQPVDNRLAKSIIHRYTAKMENVYHTLNRGVEKREIFLDKQDYLRFVHNLYEFNDEERVQNSIKIFRTDPKLTDTAARKKRKTIVDVLAFCLMPNHYHLMLSPRVKNGIPKFMAKINIGYAKYFNQKYEREGALFQGRYKKILITDNTHFLHLPFYIHFNPLDLKYPEWRENNISSPQKTLEFLEYYKWSSHLEYLGAKNYGSVLNKKILDEIFDGSAGYKKLVETYLKDIQIDIKVSLE